MIFIEGDDMIEIVKIKKVDDAYELHLNNFEVFTVDEDTILKYNLLTKKEMDVTLFNQLMQISEESEYYYKAINFISYRIRSQKEIRAYLNRFELTKNMKESIVNRLIENHFINDNEFAKAFFSTDWATTKNGPLKIKRRLIEKGVDEGVASELIKGIKHEDLIDRIQMIIDSKIKRNTRKTMKALKDKLLNDLMTQGYYKSDIEECFSNTDFEVDVDHETDLLEKEYNKVHARLSRKYDGYELKQRIIKSLVTKGFSFSQINDYLDSIN
jgi:regulatory protein